MFETNNMQNDFDQDLNKIMFNQPIHESKPYDANNI